MDERTNVRKCGLLLQTKYLGLSVCLSVCRSLTVVSRAKQAEPIEMLFGLWALGGHRELKEPCSR